MLPPSWSAAPSRPAEPPKRCVITVLTKIKGAIINGTFSCGTGESEATLKNVKPLHKVTQASRTLLLMDFGDKASVKDPGGVSDPGGVHCIDYPERIIAGAGRSMLRFPHPNLSLNILFVDDLMERETRLPVGKHHPLKDQT